MLSMVAPLGIAEKSKEYSAYPVDPEEAYILEDEPLELGDSALCPTAYCA